MSVLALGQSTLFVRDIVFPSLRLEMTSSEVNGVSICVNARKSAPFGSFSWVPTANTDKGTGVAVDDGAGISVAKRYRSKSVIILFSTETSS